MKHVFLSALATLLIIMFFLPAHSHDVREHDILRIADGKRISLEDLVQDLKKVRFVFIGERHDAAGHHEAQLAIIEALHEAGVPVAVGLEMFQSESQADLNRWVGGSMSEKAFEKIYYENWSSEWSLYRDIFLFGRDESLPMIGLNTSPELTRHVAAQGFDSLTHDQVRELPPIACDVDDAYMSFIQRSFGLHGHSQDRSFTHFCEAQMVWDSVMAWNLLSFHKKNPEFSVVVLAGSGHAWKRGIPQQVKGQSTLSYRVILPEIPGRVESTAVTPEDADYLWLGL
jgi:uncharacterized iron-regulated protein